MFTTVSTKACHRSPSCSRQVHSAPLPPISSRSSLILPFRLSLVCQITSCLEVSYQNLHAFIFCAARAICPAHHFRLISIYISPSMHSQWIGSLCVPQGLYFRSAHIFQKFRSHLKILDFRSTTWSRLLTADPKILGPTVQNLVVCGRSGAPIILHVSGPSFEPETLDRSWHSTRTQICARWNQLCWHLKEWKRLRYLRHVTWNIADWYRRCEWSFCFHLRGVVDIFFPEYGGSKLLRTAATSVRSVSYHLTPQ
jgi:hypothetical protein